MPATMNHHARRAWRRLAVAVVPAVLIGSLTTSATAVAGERFEGAPPKAGQVPNLGYSLQDDAGRRTAGRPIPASPGDTPGTVTVVVEAADPSDARAAVEASGGTFVGEAAGLVKAEVRPDRLAAVAGAAGIDRVSEPRPVITSVTSEGVASTGSSAWQTQGSDGTGTRVAIIDGGFDGYASRLGTELPAGTVADLTRCGGGTGGDEHGTGVAEIVHDMAPGAALLLLCISDGFDFIDAMDSLPADVDVVNGSIGFTLLDRGDGSGPISAAVARARDRGVLYVAAAGNSEGLHYHQNATGDTPIGEDFADFVNLPGGDDALAFAVAPFGTGVISLQWDAWPGTALDFDLYIADQFDILAGSFQVQDGNDPPVEEAVLTNPTASTQVYFVLINRYDGTGAPRLDLFFNGDVVGLETSTSSSISDPAVSSAALTAGAHCYADGGIEPFSSRGPTIDGRPKPDLSAPDGTSSSVYGTADGCSSSGFFGTSAAAPHTAGAAAQLLSANPGLQTAELQQLLVERATDAGAAGRDNVYGAGRLQLGSPAGAAVPRAPQAFTGTTPVRIFDSRPGPQYPAESPNRTTPLGSGATVRVRVRDLVGVPDDATAVVLNVTAVAPTVAGYLTVHPGGAVPNSSNLNFAKSQTVAVHVTATVAADDRVAIFNAVGSTHVVVDLAGWYGPTGSAGPSTDRLSLLSAPGRAMDTRAGPLGYAEGAFGAGGRTTPIPQGGEVAVQVAGLGGVPIAATAVVMNVTAVAPTKSTFVTAYPGGQPRPEASSINLQAGKVVANLVVVPVGPGGVVRFYNAAGNSHLIVDVTGWYQPGVGAGYVALDPPTRNLDTRTGTGLRKGALGANGTFRLKVGRYNGVPSDAAAVMLSVVATGPTAGGYLTVYPGTGALPPTSSLNFAKGTTVANAVVARLGTDGRVAFTNAAGSTHAISDLAGFFLDPANLPVP